MSGEAPFIAEVEKDATSRGMLEFGGPSEEWWAGLGTVTAALDGLRLDVFGVNEDGGKCLFLYVLSTPASSYSFSQSIGFLSRHKSYPIGLSVMTQAIP